MMRGWKVVAAFTALGAIVGLCIAFVESHALLESFVDLGSPPEPIADIESPWVVRTVDDSLYSFDPPFHQTPDCESPCWTSGESTTDYGVALLALESCQGIEYVGLKLVTRAYCVTWGHSLAYNAYSIDSNGSLSYWWNMDGEWNPSVRTFIVGFSGVLGLIAGLFVTRQTRQLRR